MKMEDDISVWVDQNLNFVFNSTEDEDVYLQYREIMNWVNDQQFLDYAKKDFADGADGWLIAYASVNNCIIVTHEVLNLEIQKKVPIPNVCVEFGVNYIDTFQMLRRLYVELILNEK